MRLSRQLLSLNAVWMLLTSGYPMHNMCPFYPQSMTSYSLAGVALWC